MCTSSASEFEHSAGLGPAPARPGDFWLVTSFLAARESATLLEWLEGIPVAETSPTDEFAFYHPVFDGVRIPRREAFAGDPVWTQGSPGRGPDMPDQLVSVMRRAQGTLAELVSKEATEQITKLSSVYVDRYDVGVAFVPHVDRDCYGEFIVGVSVGPGHCTLRFTSDDDPRSPLDFGIPSGSLYVFGGELRRSPWMHEVLDVTGLRFSVTFRGAAR